MSKVTIRPCSCDHEYQDKNYGRKLRVHNQAKSKSVNQEAWRCTVCGRLK